MLTERKGAIWGHWNSVDAVRVRKNFKNKKNESKAKAECGKCGSPMSLIKPRKSDNWKQFWGCSQYKVTGCNGSKKF